MVTGNGRHVARVMGQPEDERVICNHEELFVRFWDREIEMVADIAHLLPQVRRLIDGGKEREACDLANTEARKQLAEKGNIFPKAVVPHPATETPGRRGSIKGVNLNVSGADEVLIVIRVLPQKDGSVPERDQLQEGLKRRLFRF